MLSVWNATSGEVLQQFSEAARYYTEIPDEGGRRSLAVASGGEVIASCGGGEISVWDVPSGAKVCACLIWGGQRWMARGQRTEGAAQREASGGRLSSFSCPT